MTSIHNFFSWPISTLLLIVRSENPFLTHTFISRNFTCLLLLVPQKFLHQPSLQSCPLILMPQQFLHQPSLVMPTTTSMPANPSPVPIPLPRWQSPTAPHFDTKIPSTLCMYLSDYESLAQGSATYPRQMSCTVYVI